MNIEQARQLIKEAIREKFGMLFLTSHGDEEKLTSADLIALLPDLLKLKKLQQLYLTGNQISDITTLARLKNLYTLNLNGNQISDIAAVAELKNLRQLFLTSNEIRDITLLSKLKNLQWLSLSGNQLIEITTEITNISKLKHLLIDESQLKHFAAIVVQLKKTNLSIGNSTKFIEIPLEISSKFENGQELLDYYFKTALLHKSASQFRFNFSSVCNFVTFRFSKMRHLIKNGALDYYFLKLILNTS